ncbi:MAG: phosphatidylinositol kinase [SAR202 cluster bacterium]|nr:phosphatidylinositol kinase [SAR202 cluster bacterium]
MSVEGKSENVIDPPFLIAKQLLESAKIVSGGELLIGSNSTFLVNLEAYDGKIMRAIYKPREGERPLYDYPDKTLYRREYATFLMSQFLGWPNIPLTVIREGPLGIGTLQRFVHFDPNKDYFTLRVNRLADMASVSLFDFLVNNGDRKGGHLIEDLKGKIWSIDHGLTFHNEFKLRTVMFEYCGKSVPKEFIDDAKSLVFQLESKQAPYDILAEQISNVEIDALISRLQLIIEKPQHPVLDPYFDVPWPLV